MSISQTNAAHHDQEPGIVLTDFKAIGSAIQIIIFNYEQEHRFTGREARLGVLTKARLMQFSISHLDDLNHQDLTTQKRYKWVNIQ